MRLILASQSPYRRAQLENFGLNFEAHAPQGDEEMWKHEGPPALAELTRFLAEKKARSLQSRFPKDIILGSDQVAALGSRRLDKPLTHAMARAQLQELSGKWHELMTSLTILTPDRCLHFTDVTRVLFKPLSETLIEAYLRQDTPLDCAGAYKIEKAGLSLIERVQTEDPSAIQGLPLLSLVKGLDALKFSIADFWIKRP